VADVDDARRVAQQLDIDHLVFNFGDEFVARVVDPYVHDHVEGRTPNPCIECNRHLKFDALLHRADALGFDAVATGHHARISVRDGRPRLRRGADAAKDQSYVLYVIDPARLGDIRFPVGALTKREVRAHATRLGLRTATKPDSQDVCFITSTGGRRQFLGDRIGLHPGRLVDLDGAPVGAVDAVELVTVGQRRGLELSGAAGPRYAVAVDVAAGVVTVGDLDDLRTDGLRLASTVWADGTAPRGRRLLAQCSAHGAPRAAVWEDDGLRWLDGAQPRVARGQSVVLYDEDWVVGGGVVDS
jgi:tRNA-specific 2-thiouridylase